jgi:hypothetical protein
MRGTKLTSATVQGRMGTPELLTLIFATLVLIAVLGSLSPDA